MRLEGIYFEEQLKIFKKFMKCTRLEVNLTTVQPAGAVTNGTHARASLPTAEEGVRVCYASAAT